MQVREALELYRLAVDLLCEHYGMLNRQDFSEAHFITLAERDGLVTRREKDQLAFVIGLERS